METRSPTQPSLDERIHAFVKNKPTFVTVGAGISGPFVALGAIKKGYKVVLITKYPYAVRGQRIKISNNSLEALKEITSYENDDVFAKAKRNSILSPHLANFFNSSGINLSGLFGTGYTLSIDSIEHYLLRKLKKEEKKGNLIIIDKRAGSLTNLDVNKKTVTITATDKSSEISFPFKHIVDASGMQRAVFALLAGAQSRETATKEQLAKIENTYDLSNMHLAGCTAIFHLSSTLNKEKRAIFKENLSPGVIKISFSGTDLEKLMKKFGWNDQSAPRAFILPSVDVRKMYILCDLPNYILNMSTEDKRMAIEQYTKFIIKLHMKKFKLKVKDQDLILKEELFFNNENAKKKRIEHYMRKYGYDEEVAEEAITKKYVLRLTGIKTHISVLKDPVRCDKNKNHVITAVGDALHEAYPYFAKGANIAIESAKAFLECLPPKDSKAKFNDTKYALYCQELEKEYAKEIEAEIKKHKVFLESTYLPHNRQELESLLRVSAADGNLKRIQAILNKSKEIEINIDAISPESGETALWLAIRHGHLDVASELLEQGADANVKLPSGISLMQWTCIEGALMAAELLIVNNPLLLNCMDDNHRTPLMYAAAYGRTDLVKYLLDNGAQLSQSIDDNTALHMAAVNGKNNVVEIMLDSLSKNNFSTTKQIEISERLNPVLQAKLKLLNFEIANVQNEAIQVLINAVLYKRDPEALILYRQVLNDDPELARLCEDLNICIPVDSENENYKSDEALDENDPRKLIMVLCYEFARFIYHNYWKTQNNELSIFSTGMPPSGILELRKNIESEEFKGWKINPIMAQQLLFKLKEVAIKNLDSISLLRTKSTKWLYETLANLNYFSSDIQELDYEKLLYSLNKLFAFIEKRKNITDTDKKRYFAESDNYKNYRMGINKTYFMPKKIS